MPDDADVVADEDQPAPLACAAAERLLQIGALRRPVLIPGAEGGAWQGADADRALWQCDDPQPPNPEHVVLTGDFNAEHGSAEYRLLTAPRPDGFGLADAWTGAHPQADAGTTFYRDVRQGADWDQRIDYVFLSPGLQRLPRRSWTDAAIRACDHQPLWVELGGGS